MLNFHSTTPAGSRRRLLVSLLGTALLSSTVAQTITINTSAGARGQIIDGFGTCLAGTEAEQAWWQNLYFDDLGASILRMDLTPPFKAPITGNNGTYNSPWYHNNPSLPGPKNNNVRAYTNANDYTSTYNAWRAPIAVMGPNIDRNATNFNFSHERPRVVGAAARAGFARTNQLGDFKLIGSFWSPAPWVKISSGNTYPNGGGTPMPVPGTRWPFIWFDNFAGGKLDTSGTLITNFNDGSLGGTGDTSALTQFARGAAAYIRAFQRTNNLSFYAISIQNELNFEEFYTSCTYPHSAGYIAALKAVRAEFDKYPDLAPIKLMGPEDLLGGDIWGMWQYGGGSTTVHKNLQYLQNIAADPQATAAEAFFCIHGYANDGVSAANANPQLWTWWANGWTASPNPGIPANVKGFTAYGKKSWMTETSGENPAWLHPDPASGYPGEGAWGLALRLHQALTTGRQSAWVYWHLTDGSSVSVSTLTDAASRTNSAKYVAAKHFFKFIRPNAVRVAATVTGSTNLLASAYLHETNQTLTVVLLNTSSNSIQATLVLPAQPAGLTALRSFTSSKNSLWKTSSLPVTNQTAMVTAPGYGVVTLYGVAAPLLRVAQASPGQIVLSWLPASVGFKLQRSASLSPANWQMDNSPGAISNGVVAVTEAPPTNPAYFRLILP